MLPNKSKSLPNGITSDIELNEWSMQNIPGFRGVISRSDFKKHYKLLKPGDSLIINLDPNYSQNGTHWVAFRISSEAPIAYYKDSFGAPPPSDIINSVTDRGLLYGNRIFQKMTESNCGKRSALFLKKMSDSAKNKREIETFEMIEKVN